MLGKEMKVEDLGRKVIFLIRCSVCLLLTSLSLVSQSAERSALLSKDQPTNTFSSQQNVQLTLQV